jgi:acyl carrier protein
LACKQFPFLYYFQRLVAVSGRSKALLCSGAMRELEEELKTLIIEALELDDVSAESIQSDAPLFGKDTELALDSIDALELSVALSKKYDVTLKSDDEVSRNALHSVASLAKYIADHRSSP